MKGSSLPAAAHDRPASRTGVAAEKRTFARRFSCLLAAAFRDLLPTLLVKLVRFKLSRALAVDQSRAPVGIVTPRDMVLRYQEPQPSRVT